MRLPCPNFASSSFFTIQRSAFRRLLALAWLGLMACAALPGMASGATATEASRVKFSTSEGEFVVEVYADKAPKTVANFLQYVRDKHYDGTVFHRVISNFMVQGGGFDARYAQKPTRPSIQHEGREALARGGDKNVVGTLAMARTNDPHSASAQFFINVKDNDFLNPTLVPPGDPVPRFEYQGRVYTNVPRAQLLEAPELFGYTVFGKVVSGMDVVNKIRAVPTGPGGPFPSDVPRTPVLINSASLLN